VKGKDRRRAEGKKEANPAVRSAPPGRRRSGKAGRARMGARVPALGLPFFTAARKCGPCAKRDATARRIAPG
jgi:hypothetical protein